MLVTLYAVIAKNRIEWFHTLAVFVDLKQRPRETCLFITPQVPIFYAKQWIEATKANHFYESKQQHIADAVISLQKFAQTLKWPILSFAVVQPNLNEAQFTAESVKIEQFARFCHLVRGRSLFPNELITLLQFNGCSHAAEHWQIYVQHAYLAGEIELSAAISSLHTVTKPSLFRRMRVTYRCNRCGTTSENFSISICALCKSNCYYCQNCLQMGRAKQCSILIRSPQRIDPNTNIHHLSSAPHLIRQLKLLTNLTPLQKQASEAAVQFLLAPHHSSMSQSFLLWAVTGAGKTEMIFPLIESAIGLNKKIALVTPRKDVVLELLPRLVEAFPVHKVVALYGGSEQAFVEGDIIVATTHQMVRYDQAFEVMIIDEIDAFPYHNNPMLQCIVEKSVHPYGRYILLSATPSPNHLRLVKQRKLPCAVIAQRYHGHPLPVPRYVRTTSIRQQIHITQLHSTVNKLIRLSLDRGARLFIFVPYTTQVIPFADLLRCEFPTFVVEGTCSKDSARATTIAQFRAYQIDILVTTTILERGVTVPFVDVLIFDADCAQFDSAALIQMAGRAGRSNKDPNGNVYFCAPDRTYSQKEAIRQIKWMNHRAKQ
jgi:competence protein ComFA